MNVSRSTFGVITLGLSVFVCCQTASADAMPVSGPAEVLKAFPSVGQVHRYENGLDSLIAPDTSIEKLTGDKFIWSEGPVWLPEHDYLLFSDVPANTIYQWSQSEGLSVFMQPAGIALEDGSDAGEGTNGLILSLEGQLLTGDHSGRVVMSIDLTNKEKTVLASQYEGQRFNSPNDLIISRHRWPKTIFFTDPPYGLKDQDESSLKQMQTNGVYRLTTDGVVTLLDESLKRPNGINLSPDESKLYVANSDSENAFWRVYELDDNGDVVGQPKEFASAQKYVDEGRPGLPDGMAVDVDGNIFATGPGGVWVFDPNGRALGLIETGTAAANCAFGGPDGRYLYITSHKFLARILTTTQGLEFATSARQ